MRESRRDFVNKRKLDRRGKESRHNQNRELKHDGLHRWRGGIARRSRYKPEFDNKQLIFQSVGR